MNKEYIKELFEEYKDNFIKQGIDITTPEDLIDTINFILKDVFGREFDVSIDFKKMFKGCENNEKN